MRSIRNATPGFPLRRKSRRRARGFVLLEVLVSLAILGITISMTLRSFTMSLKAARRGEQITVAQNLAQRLLDEWEFIAPDEGTTTGDFGENFPRYTFEAKYEPEEIDYDNVSRLESVGRLAYFRRINLTVYYNPERRDGRRRLLKVYTALTGAERFTRKARLANGIGFD